MKRNLLIAATITGLLLAAAALRAEEAIEEAPVPVPTPGNCSQEGFVDFGEANPPVDPNLGWRTSGGYSSCHENWQLAEGRWVEFSFCGRMNLRVEFLADDDSCVKWPRDYYLETTINDVADDHWDLSGVDSLVITADHPLLTFGENRVRITIVGDVPETEGCYLDGAKTY